VDNPSVLLFDLGGVLVHNAGPGRLAALLPDLATREDVASRWLASPVVRAFESGKLEPGQFARQLVHEWQLKLGADELLAEFATWATGLYPGAAELLGQLRGEFRLACLSNSNPLHWAHLRELLANFDTPLASHELGEVKPDPVCFALALDRLGVGSREVAFFDDAPANVATASALGMRAFCVNGLDETRTRLQTEGWIR
jgi:HAD superfamily hydrolase (TIGR01509 family)